MRDNDKYIIKHWKKLAVYLLIIGIVLLFSLINGLYASFIPTVILIAIALTFYFYKKKSVKNSLQKYFQYETPEFLIDYYDKIYKMRKMRDKDAWLVYNKALAYCYYGEFDIASSIMTTVDWNNRVPYIQSLELSIRALIHYLKHDNYKEGLRLSIIMQKLGDFSANVPGSTKARDFFEIYIQIGELLSGNIRENTIEGLEMKFENSPFYPKVLIAWGLANTYKKLSMNDKMEGMLNYCKKLVPYCKPLCTLCDIS